MAFVTDLVVCDLDGTLLRSDATLSPFARDGLNHLIGAGVPITVASARSLPAMRALLSGVDLTLPVIELNGAFVSHPRSGEHLLSNTVVAAVPTVELLLSLDLPPVLTTFDGTRDNVWFNPAGATTWFVEEKQRYGDPRLRLTHDLTAVARSEQVAAITVFVPTADFEHVASSLQAVAGDAALAAAPHEYCTGYTEINIQSPQATKGHALLALRALCGLTGQITVCGDHLNDLSMFAIADHSVAPANAKPAVLAAASVITESNDSDGVIRFLLSHAA